MLKPIAVAAAAVMFASPVFAWEGKVVACYDKVFVPAQFKTTKHLHKPAKTVWEYRHGQAVEVYYAPVYKETRHQTHPAHYVKRKAACKS